MQITVDFTEEQSKTRSELASTYGIEPAVLFRSAVRGLFANDTQRFEDAARYVLDKNAELLDRLSR